LKLIYDARKTNVDSISKNMALVGHDTELYKATDKAYNSVDACCKYRDKEVVDAHKN
ncbi:MAG: ATPase, partial [Winogradskyella sp.]|nr:ATPase [Winogradskyella sp.]